VNKRLRNTVVALTLAIGLTAPTLALAPANADDSGWTELAAGHEPATNPLKGFIPYQGSYTTFPYSMEWQYFPVNAVMSGPDTFDWTKVDEVLDDIASRGHQTALRFYLDYPTKPSGVPQYLLDGGLNTHAYDDYGNDGVSVIPDYDDPALRTAMDHFIAALGERYDGDPRIGYLQAGLLGFWGEWHTYPYNGTGGKPDYFASASTQQEVLQDFVGAFHKTQLEVRNPDSANAALPIGYHDDSFALETKTSSLGWHFMDNMTAAGATDKWKQYSIGGELRPELQGCIFSAAGCPELEDGGDNDFPGSVAQTHATWMINQYAFGTGYSAADKATALAATESLGYSFRTTEALVPASTTATAIPVGMEVENTGVAPFYYDWPITLAAVDATGAVVRTVTTAWHLSDIASGATKRFTGTMDLNGLPAGSYSIVAQGTNPLANGTPIRFANAAQDSVAAGWLTLGSTTVTAAATTPPTPSPTPVPTAAPGAGTPTASAPTASATAAPTAADPTSTPAAGIGRGAGDPADRGTLAFTGSTSVPLGIEIAAGLLLLGVVVMTIRRRTARR
jgi:hypothetical protein